MSITITETKKEEIIFNAMTEMFASIQTQLGIDDGGFCDIHFSDSEGEEEIQEIEEILKRYINAELSE
jgi:hypothetical protein